MDPTKKGELIGGCVGSLCIYVLLGIMLYFRYGYDLFNIVRILGSVTLVIAMAGALFTALVWLLLFIKSKINR